MEVLLLKLWKMRKISLPCAACMCMCVCARARACVCVRVRARACVCVCARARVCGGPARTEMLYAYCIVHVYWLGWVLPRLEVGSASTCSNMTSCVSRELVTGLPSLLANTMCRNWLLGMSLTNVHLIWNEPLHLAKKRAAAACIDDLGRA